MVGRRCPPVARKKMNPDLTCYTVSATDEPWFVCPFGDISIFAAASVVDSRPPLNTFRIPMGLPTKAPHIVRCFCWSGFTWGFERVASEAEPQRRAATAERRRTRAGAVSGGNPGQRGRHSAGRGENPHGHPPLQRRRGRRNPHGTTPRLERRIRRRDAKIPMGLPRKIPLRQEGIVLLLISG